MQPTKQPPLTPRPTFNICCLFPLPPPKKTQSYLLGSPLGRSGVLPSFSLVFLSELGDKTFFITALLAIRMGRCAGLGVCV